MRDALRHHALHLLARLVAHSQRRPDEGRAVDISRQEVDSLLATRWQESPPKQSAGDDDLPAPTVCWEALDSELISRADAGDKAARRWLSLIKRLGLERESAQLLALLVAIGSDHDVLRGYRYVWADARRQSLPLGVALEAVGHVKASQLLGDEASIYRHQLVSRHRERADLPTTELGVRAHDDTVAWLLGHEVDRTDLRSHQEIPLPPRRLTETLDRVIARSFEDEVQPAHRWLVHGPPGAGRMGVAAALVKSLAPGGLWTLDLGQVVESGAGLEGIRLAVRGAVLSSAGVVVTGVERLTEQVRPRWAEAVERVWHGVEVPLVWLVDDEPPDFIDVHPNTIMPVSYPSRSQRRKAWARLLGQDGLPDDEVARLAGRFLLTERQIERTVVEGRARTELKSGNSLSSTDETRSDRELSKKQLSEKEADTYLSELESVARREAAVGLGRLATPETTKVSLDQLIIDDETQILLQEIISYTASRKQLASDWGFENLMPYGLGVTALFAGPPGTGKTLAANAIATALGLELFRVDLSQLVSKYIGETEKHLATLFNAAEQGEVMLLFDEADSLFSKRTEVKSSTDRYANLEVNYLLQRVERFDGVVILTTNFEAGIDDAFARRIRFRVHFAEPDEEARKLLWRLLTPPAVPLGDDVDFDVLAEDYELTGGHIKECVLRAASLAMTGESESGNVTQDLLIRSAEAEYRKLGKLLITTTDYAP